ncbi:XRE family transcriptional regulator [[Clostridium] sordellii]|uniref:helix-turn-helix domain-containing protein n=1 Tax=Paraclostridium sordellii TaxID=1505 RepID=UPI0005E456F4|nr:XRE family transcriptional regulator [Paeniclostridium sordellii]CEP45570.1 XRE family transcriptional regulator [[Clostridium] sordellii] [Paeniclostridium sordellii]
MKSLPHNLKKLRKNANLNQESLSKILNISRQTLSYYECGTREPDLDTLINISNFFNCSIDYLVTGNTQENINDKSKQLLTKEDFSPKNLLKNLKEKRVSFENSINKIDKLINFLENEFDLDINADSTNNYNSKKDIMIDSNSSNKFKTEIAEETSPVISLDEYKSSKNSIDVDFYRNNDVKIFTSYSSKRDNKNLVSIPFYGDISCGALKYMGEHLSEYFYLNPNDLRYDDSEYFVLQVDGESMNKLYKNGDFLLVKKTSCFDSFNKPYVFYFDDSATLKYIELNEEILRLIPHSTKNYEPKILTFEELQYMQHGVVGTIEGVLNFIED